MHLSFSFGSVCGALGYGRRSCEAHVFKVVPLDPGCVWVYSTSPSSKGDKFTFEMAWHAGLAMESRLALALLTCKVRKQVLWYWFREPAKQSVRVSDFLA